MNTVDTIAALASGVNGAIAVLRLSGAESLNIAHRLINSKVRLDGENTRKMMLVRIGCDHALAVYFKGPASYTGDDVVEFQCHGGARVAKSVLELLLAQPECRLAEPGEFTFRAFVNGKLDLVQSEAVADLIASDNDMAMKIASRQLEGSLSGKLHKLRDELIFCLSECESRLDFPEENLDWDEELPEKIGAALEMVQQLLNSRERGDVFRNGVKTVIVGKPNAGKSSLLNFLLGYDRAIVTDIAGTTRDALEESVIIRNIPVRLIDTAGLRENAEAVEKIGIERSYKHLDEAQVVFWMLDASQPDIEELLKYSEAKEKIIAVWNKCDLISADTVLPELPMTTVRISVLEGRGLDDLSDAFEKMVWEMDERASEADFAVNARHAAWLNEMKPLLGEAIMNCREREFELAAVQLHAAVRNLGFITGETADVDILGEIFSRFCIGK